MPESLPQDHRDDACVPAVQAAASQVTQPVNLPRTSTEFLSLGYVPQPGARRPAGALKISSPVAGYTPKP
jgi:hypothetical protein